MHVGKSPFHTGNMLLVTNTLTEIINLQFNLVFDNSFKKIKNICKGSEIQN